jgi:hypothetical protein
MNPTKIVVMMICLAFALLGMALLTSCTTLGISFNTDYGSFTYQLPEPKGTKK